MGTMAETRMQKKVEEALRSKMKSKALKECEPTIAKFAECAKGRTLSVVWTCRSQSRELNTCLHQYTNDDVLAEYKKQYLAGKESGSGRYLRGLASLGVDCPPTPSPSPGQQRTVEKIWRQFFSDPSQWWDHRSEKRHARYPDFKHKKTRDVLWLNSNLNPPWVEAELATLAPGSLQLSVFSWNKMLARHVKNGQFEKCLEVFQHMLEEGIMPDRYTFVPVVNACAQLRALQLGRQIHTQIIRSGCETDVFVGSSLISMYAKSGSMEDAWIVFNRMPIRDVVAWNAIILGYLKSGQGQKALDLFEQMAGGGVEPDPVTFVAILNACASVGALEQGRHVHSQLIQSGCESHVFVSNSLVDMYAKCGSIQDAWRLFSKMPRRDVVTWNAMILGCVKCGQGQKALELFKQMQIEGVQPDPVTFVGFVNACAGLLELEEGRRVHTQIIQSGCQSDVFVGSSLVNMYAKCGSIEDAWTVFKMMLVRDVVAWNAMILGFVKCGQAQKALELYGQMQQEGVEPDPVTFIGVLNACASVAALEEGKRVHGQVIESGCESDVFVGNSLVDMYAKCGSTVEAWGAFSRIHKRDVVAWNAMIMGYVKCGQGQMALELFRHMQGEQLEPDRLTFVGVLNACASVAAFEEGRRIHAQIIQSGYKNDVFVNNSLVDMYAKCGSIEDAWTVFSKMPKRNVVSWNAMLGGYAMHGHAKEALGLFKRMCEEGVELDRVSFVSLLSACSHGGLVDEGLHYFESMISVYRLPATKEHCACVVDLLGRAGRLCEAEDMINRMNGEPDVVLWTTLLGACRVHGKVEMGERISRQILGQEPGNASAYVLLSNIYAAAGKWGSSADVQQQRKERGVKKEVGCTWIEVNHELHSFTVDHQQHPQINSIHAELVRLSEEMNKVGYKPDTSFVLHDVEDQEKVSRLCYHSEKLAIAFGLISTAPGTPIRIFKNLRVCGDCHTASKFIAQLTGRAIIVRDGNRFHHFEAGTCSCGDYW